MGPRDFVEILSRRRRASLTVLALCFALAVLVALILPDIYKAETTIVLNNQDTRLSEPLAELERIDFNRGAVETEMDVIQSLRFLGRIVDVLNLQDDPDFNPYLSRPPTPPSNPLEAVAHSISEIRESIRHVAGLLGIWPESNLVPPTEAEQKIAIVKKLQSGLGVERSGESLAIRVSYSHTDGPKAARVVNRIAENYIAASLERKQISVTKAIALLRRRASALTKSISDTEGKIAELIRAHKLDDETLDDKLRTRIAQLKAQLKIVQNSKQPAADIGLMKTLETELGSLEVEQADHTRAKLTRLQLEREVQTDSNRHAQVVGRLANLDSQVDVLDPSARIVSDASPLAPPSSPHRLLIVVAGLGSGIVLAVMLAMLLEGMDTRIHLESRLAGITQLPNLGVMPVVSGLSRHGAGLHHKLLDNPHSHAVESLSTAHFMIRGSRTNETKVMMAVSGWSGEGKTTISIGLAVAAVLSGYRTAVVDLDLRSANLSQALGLHGRELGIESLLSDEAELDDVLVRDLVPGLDVIPAKSQTPQPGKLMHSAVLPELINTLRENYDAVFIDTPASLLVGDAFVVGRLVDAAYLVVYRGRSQSVAVREVMKRLQIQNVPIVGTVINGYKKNMDRQYGYNNYAGYYAPAKKSFKLN